MVTSQEKKKKDIEKKRAYGQTKGHIERCSSKNLKPPDNY